MSLTKEITDKKVNFEFNKEFINVFSKKIKDNDTNFLDKTLKELGFSNPRDKYGLAVIAIRRSDTDITLNPDINDRLQAGDWLIFAGKDELIDQIEIAD